MISNRRKIEDLMLAVEWYVSCVRDRVDASHNGGRRADLARRTLPGCLAMVRRNLARLEAALRRQGRKGGAS